MTKTSKPIAAVAYNTKNFLIMKLNDLIAAHTIMFWMIILHQPDTDDAKEHWHVYVELAQTVKVNDFWDNFIEYDVSGPSMPPLKCVFNDQTTNFSNWLLYILHDPEYLESKGQSRNIQYSLNDVINSDEDMFNLRFNDIDFNNLYKFSDREKIEHLRNGGSTLDLIQSGRANLREINFLKTVEREIRDNTTTTAGNEVELRQDIDELTRQLREVNAANKWYGEQLAVYRCLFGDIGEQFDDVSPEEYAEQEIYDFWTDLDNPEKYYFYWPPDSENRQDDYGLLDIRDEYRKFSEMIEMEKLQDPAADLEAIEEPDFPFQ